MAAEYDFDAQGDVVLHFRQSRQKVGGKFARSGQGMVIAQPDYVGSRRVFEDRVERRRRLEETKFVRKLLNIFQGEGKGRTLRGRFRSGRGSLSVRRRLL
jgi:hypothetical protein